MLSELYLSACTTPSDINEHVPTHTLLASQCLSVVEIGVRSMVSTWGLLTGLPQNSNYIGIDLHVPPPHNYELARACCQTKCIDFKFIARDDMLIDPSEIGNVDMIFIESLHTYTHLTYELETFSHLAQKYLTFHDTSKPWVTRMNKIANHGIVLLMGM